MNRQIIDETEEAEKLAWSKVTSAADGPPGVVAQVLPMWEPYEGLTQPPSEPIKLFGSSSCTIYLADAWGPPVPYPAIDHRNGHKNSGYIQLKSKKPPVERIPEAEGWPELQWFLKIVNAS